MYEAVEDSLFCAAERGTAFGIATDGSSGPQWLAIAELFPHTTGIAFAEAGWPDAPDKSFHVVEGAVEQAPSGNGWIVGNSWVFPLHPRSRLKADLDAWMVYRGTPEGRRMTRAVCRQVMECHGVFNASPHGSSYYARPRARILGMPALQP